LSLFHQQSFQKRSKALLGRRRMLRQVCPIGGNPIQLELPAKFVDSFML
jgi:hypothetical protein